MMLDSLEKLEFTDGEINTLHLITKESIKNKTEFGANIRGSLDFPRMGRLEKGLKAGIWLPDEKDVIGTFHTHPEARAWVSTRDFLSTISKGQYVIIIGGRTIRKRTMGSEVKAYIANPESNEYKKMIKTVEEFSIAFRALKIIEMETLGKQLMKQGHNAFRKTDYGFTPSLGG